MVSAWRRRTASLVGGAAVIAALAGCGSGSGAGSGASSVPGSTEATTPATTPAMVDTNPPIQGATTPCTPSSDPAPAFPIDAPGEGSASGVSGPGAGWRYVEENRTIVAGEDEVRDAAELFGHVGEAPDGPVFQALSAGTGGRTAWNEFHWDDPQWSSRNADEPTWTTVTEPGAFEPPYRFAYFTRLESATLTASLVDGRVFEGEVDAGGVSLQRYCVDEPDLGDTREGGRLRFLVHPDGYVSEWVYGQRSDTEARCVEITLDIAPDITVPGLRDEVPTEWFTELRHLSSCRAAYEADRVDVEVAVPPTSTTLPVVVETGAWHEEVDDWCRTVRKADPADVDRDAIANRFESWLATAPSVIESEALIAAARIIGSSETDPRAFEPIGRRLEAAGLPVCATIFLGG